MVRPDVKDEVGKPLSSAMNIFIFRASEAYLRHFNRWDRGMAPKLISCVENLLPVWKTPRAVRWNKPCGTKCQFADYIRDQCSHLSVKKLSAKSCITHVKVVVSRCSTCCCPQGLISTSVSHNLIYGKQTVCGTFFSIADAAVRITVSGWRTGLSLSHFHQACFTAAQPPGL